MNENAFFDDFILSYLYKKGSISTLDIETEFGNACDQQNVNNVICNRGNRTSYIRRGYMEYDDEKHTLSITEKGRRFLEGKYSGKRQGQL